VVRGTKTIADAVTDFILEASDYRGGKAHAGMIDSGKWLAEKHADLFDELRKLSGKKKIKLTLIGHSLGAGAAAIAALELNDKKNLDVNVVGFGCPALLSKELSESASDYITTVICDSDVIPRMSGATVANIALDIMEYDRYPKLQRDAKLALDDLAENLPDLVTDDRKKTVVDYIDSASEELRKKLLKPKTEERVPPVLFPPGKCVHFYRDGHSISGSIAPCTFFGEIDVTRTMVDDHLISTGYGKIFLDLMRVYHDDENFRFEDRSGTK
jgi:pimeloyl-ACP methyl ester carboxylesterase